MSRERTGSLFSLLSEFPGYRRLWTAEIISFVGDWFTFIALVRLVRDETGGRLAVGALIAAQMVPNLLFSSLAGSTADRVPRRTVMIASDLMRAGGALAFILPRALGLHGNVLVGSILALVTFQHSVTSFFRPACSACIPNLVPQERIGAAGTLDGIAWSLGLIVGSALGGIAADLVRPEICFVLDAGTFIASALLIRGLPLPRIAAAARTTARKLQFLGDFRELFHEMRVNRMLVVSVLAKTAWGVGAAQLLLLTEFGDHMLGPGAASLGFGMLYAARGIGTACGPSLSRRVLGETTGALLTAVGGGFAGAAAFYLLLSTAPGVPGALLCVAGAHAGGSLIWIGATVLVQRTAPDRVRGRAFAFEMAMHTITASASALLAGRLVDEGVPAPRIVAGFALATAVLGAIWACAAYSVHRAAKR